MRCITTDVTRSVVCVLVTAMCCAKTAKLIEMPFGKLTHMGARNRVLDGVKIGRICSQLRGMISHRCGILPYYFGHLLLLRRVHMSCDAVQCPAAADVEIHRVVISAVCCRATSPWPLCCGEGWGDATCERGFISSRQPCTWVLKTWRA